MESELGSEIIIDENGEVAHVELMNETDLPDSQVLDAIMKQRPEIATLARWVNDSNGGSRGRNKTVFDQDRYVAPKTIFDEMRLAAHAAKYDDIVSNAVDTTEQLAFKRVVVECDDDNENKIWAQITDEIDLSLKLREMWREQFIVSQFYAATLWHKKDYKVPNSRKVYKKLLVPRGITLLDPLKVLPVGDMMFGNETLVYLADQDEGEDLNRSLARKNSSDLVLNQLITGKYEASKSELSKLTALTGLTDIKDRMFILNPDNVWRVTATKPDYQRFADVRLASVFELLDLKNVLREMDRSEILSATNCIILVTKGSDKYPATQSEIAGAAAQVSRTSRVPIIVSDHRLNVEIITRKTDKVLTPERYNGLDSRITSRLYQILSTGSYSSGTAMDNSPNLFRIISSTMEARRDNIRDGVMTHVIRKIWQRNDQLKKEPKMNFYPRRIALDFDNNIALYIQDLKDRNIISAETQLAELDIILDEEIGRIKRENKKYGDILQYNQVPYSAPVPNAATPGPGQTTGIPRADGRAGGGNRNGGGANPASYQPSPNNRGE